MHYFFYSIALVLLCSIQTYAFPSSKYQFLGYVSTYPVFTNLEGDVVTVRGGEELSAPLYKLDQSQKALYIKDNTFIYIESCHNRSCLVFIKGDEEYKFETNEKVFKLYGDEEKAFFTSSISKKVLKITKEGISETGIIGNVVGFVDNCIYFSNEHDPKLVYANADIFKTDVDNFDRSLVAMNVSGESTYILPDGRYIYDQMLFQGEFRPCIIDVKATKHALLDVNSLFIDNSCFFSFQLNKLVFFNAENLDLYPVEIPTDFPYDN